MEETEIVETPSGERPRLPPEARLTFTRTMPAVLPETLEHTMDAYEVELTHVVGEDAELRIEEKKDGTNVRVVLGRALRDHVGEPIIAHTRKWVRVEEVEEMMATNVDPEEHEITVIEGEFLPLSAFATSVYEIWSETLDFIDYHFRLMRRYTLNPNRKRVPRSWIGKLFDRLSKVRRHVKTLETVQRRLKDVKLADERFEELVDTAEALLATAHSKDYVPKDAEDILRDIVERMVYLRDYEPKDIKPTYYVYQVDVWDGDIKITAPKTEQYELLADVIDGEKIKPVPSTKAGFPKVKRVAKEILDNIEKEGGEGIVVKPERETPGVPHARKVRTEEYLRGMKLDSRLRIGGFKGGAERAARNETRKALAAIETSYLYRSLDALAEGDLSAASRIVEEAEKTSNTFSDWDDPTI